MGSESRSNAALAATNWATAHANAKRLLEGALRFRVPGASPGVEISGLDWGGEGPLVLMHHANGFCAASFAEIASTLADRYRVVALDARGHGESTPVPASGGGHPYHWETMSLDAENATRTILERTGRERIDLAIGHSFGGALLLRMATRSPSLVERLLLCDPVILPPMPASVGAAGAPASPLVAATLRRRDRFPDFEAAFEHCRSRGLFANFTPQALALYVGEGMVASGDGDVRLRCDREVEAAIFEGDGRDEMCEGSEDASAEVVFVHAQRGNFQVETYREIAAAMKRARVESHDVGHLFPLEAPEFVLRFVAEMLPLP